MFQGVPREKIGLTWFFFITWSCLIFIAVPFAPAVVRWVTGFVPLATLLFGSVAVIMAATTIAMVYLYRLAPMRRGRNLSWMCGILIVYIYYCFFEVKADQEALHFIEYGFLGLLAFRALSHRIRDPSIYVSAIIMVTVVATIDEMIQWLTPLRYYDLNDVKFDAVSAFLAQVAIARGMRPPFIVLPIKPYAVRFLCRLALAELLLLGACVWNTPARVVSYTNDIPWLQFLQHNDSVMSEYGYRYVDREIGVFYSRFTLEELYRLDRARGDSVGSLIAQNYGASTNYVIFLRLKTAGTDPFLHEAMGHLAQRDHYAAVTWKFKDDPKKFKLHNTVAYRENQILEKYFPRTLAAAGARATGDQIGIWEQNLATDRAYKSQISNHLIVRFREGELTNLLFAGILFVVFTWWFWGRDPESHETVLSSS